MRENYLIVGIESLERGLEYLEYNSRDAFLYGYQGISSLLKAASFTYDLFSNTEDIILTYEDIVEELINKKIVDREESKNLLNIGRMKKEEMTITKEKLDFFALSLYNIFPLVEKIVKDSCEREVKYLLSEKSNDILVRIKEIKNIGIVNIH